MEKKKVAKKATKKVVNNKPITKKVSKTNTKKKKGFTLIELLAVIIILGILMIIAIPSVTSYISDSRKSAYVDTAKEIVGGARNIVNSGKLGMYDTNTTYYIPASYINTENGLKSPYGEFTQAYVGVVYDGKGYKYYWISNDDTGQGIDDITSLETLDNELIKSDIKDEVIRNKVETTSIGNREKIVILGEDGVWGETKIATEYFSEEGEEVAYFLTGAEINIKMKQLSGNAVSENAEMTTDTRIKAIKYSNNEPSESNKESKNLVSTTDSPYPIYMWYENETIYWWSEDKTPSLNSTSSYMFRGLSSLTDISGLRTLDTSAAKNFFALFHSDTSMKDYTPLKNWNVSKVTNMNYAFSSNTSLVSLNGLENWNTSSLKGMAFLLNGNTALADVSALKNWKVDKVTTMRQLFCSCVNLEVVDLSGWKTSALTDATNLFGMWNSNGTARTDSKLKRIILSDKFDTSKVTSMTMLLANNTKIEDYSFLQYFDTSNVVSMQQMFQYNYGLKNLEYLRNWDVSNVTSMVSMFNRNSSLTDASAINDWNISKDINYNYMFQNTPSHPTFTKVSGTWNGSGTFIPN